MEILFLSRKRKLKGNTEGRLWVSLRERNNMKKLKVIALVIVGFIVLVILCIARVKYVPTPSSPIIFHSM